MAKAHGRKLNITNRILGLPLKFTANTDPVGRTFYENFLCTANIVNIAVGKPTFTNGSLRSEKTKMLNEQISKIFDDPANAGSSGLFTDAAKNIASSVDDNNWENNGWFHNKIFNLTGEMREKDLRFYAFDYDYKLFQNTCNVLFQELFAKMIGASIHSNISSFFDTTTWGRFGISFWIEGTSQCSESVSNDISDISAASESAQASDAAREAAFLLGKDNRAIRGIGGIRASKGSGSGSLIKDAENMYKSAVESSKAMLQGLISNDAGAAQANGERIVFPKMWKNSTYDKSYSLNFRFISPYGDPEAILEYVYAPFVILLAMAMPRQYSADSYGSPPLLRIDCPGNFCCDMGMISSISIVKGTSQELWSAKGYPMGIDVTLQVTDMYPSLSMPINKSMLKQNIGMSTMLDNMAGLNMMQMNLGRI